MKHALYKDAFREIGKNLGRFLSIFLIVGLGAAFFAGVKASAPDMKYTADQYYDQYNMMDLRILSSMGLTAEDIEAIKAQDGVASVQASYFADVVTTINANEFVFRIHSLPAEAIQSGSEDFLNKPKLTAGRYPENPGECIIEDSNAIDLGLQIGDTLTVSSGKKTDLTDVLRIDTFTIVGKAVSPYYLTYDKDASDIGSGKVNFFMMILSTDFSYPVYTEALVTVQGARDMNSYSPEYQRLVDKIKNQLDNLVAERSETRLVELKEYATDQLNEKRAELKENEDKFNREIADAQAKLDAAQDKLVGGQATLDAEKESYALRTADAQQQIDEGEVELAEGEQEYKSAVNQYNEANAEYKDMLSYLDQATTALNNIDTNSQTQIDSLTNQLNTDTTLTDTQRTDYQSQIDTLKGNQSDAKKGLADLNNLNNSAKQSMKDAKTQLATSKAKLNAAKAKLAKAKADLAAAKVEAEEKFAAAEKQIAEGTTEYQAAKEEFDTKKAEGEAELEDAKEQVIRAENKIDALSKPSFYVLDRTKLYSYADYAATADRMDGIAKLLPVFFFLVAALVCLTTMTRMVDEQRGTIGAFKALGYTNREIAFKYVSYAVIASALGGTLGVFAGIKVFPRIIFDSWSMMYTLPPMQETPQVLLMVLTVLAGMAITTFAAYASCKQELRITPAFLMRPKISKPGKTILIEKMHLIWNHFSFSQKVTARNLFLYKKRFFMTVIGIAGCAALLVAGFGLSNSIGQIVDKQFKQIFIYNLSTKFTPTTLDEDKEKVVELLKQNSNVASLLRVTEMNAKIKSSGDEISTTLICPENSEELPNYISLQDRLSQRKLTLPVSGLIISEKLSRELGVGVGDSVTVDNGDGAIKKLEISGITENYIFHFAYISKEYYQEIFRLAPNYNSLLIKLAQASNAMENQLGTELIALDQVASVTYYSDAAIKFQDTVKSLDAIVYVIIACAGLLAFVVLYNLTNINLSERIREIATIKVLGFYNREVSAYVYRENIILSIIGAGAGLLLGIYLHRTIMSSIEQSGVMFGDYIAGTSFLYAFAITLFFSMLVNLFMYRRLSHIHMVESLKTIE
ncbi:MAG: FtsX-like permease family protein [Clostridiaceae bacterium]|nr:FtsX-like permease family protein [Clostridiaceae bacterium]